MLVKDLIAILSKCDGKQPVYIETDLGDVQTIWGISENDCKQVFIQGDLYVLSEDRKGTLFDFNIKGKTL